MRVSLYTRFKEFCWRNQVYIVCLPMLAGLHYSWLRLQHTPGVLEPGEKPALPFEKIYNTYCTGFKYISNKITGTQEEDSTNGENKKPTQNKK